MLSALEQAMISVKDLDAATRFYRDLIGLEVLSECELPPAGIRGLWGLSQDLPAQVRVLGKPDQLWGQVRLVRFTAPSDVVIREKARLFDSGLFDIAFLGDDAEKTRRIFLEAGYSTSQVGVYDIAAYKDMRLREVLVKGADGVYIAFLHYDPPYAPPELRGFSELLHSVIIVSDMKRSLFFYRDLLEMDPQTDMIMDNDIVRNLLQLPPQARVRMVSLRRRKGFTGRVMLFQVLDTRGEPMATADFAEESRPPNLGLCLLSFSTSDLDTLKARLRQRDIEVVCPPQPIEGELFEGGRAMSAISPEGTLLEFRENPALQTEALL